MQQFDTFALATDAQPQSSLPPSQWKCGRGRQAVEMIRPEAAMTLFVKVSDSSPHLGGSLMENDLERPLGEAGKGHRALTWKSPMMSILYILLLVVCVTTCVTIRCLGTRVDGWCNIYQLTIHHLHMMCITNVVLRKIVVKLVLIGQTGLKFIELNFEVGT